MTKNFNLENDLKKILPLILNKIKKEMKHNNEDDQIKKVQAYTKLLEQLIKMLKLIECEPNSESLEQESRIIDNYLKFQGERDN